jgi:hypothetical protein
MIYGVRVNGRRRNALRFSARRLLQVLTRRSSELLDARREPGQVARRTADQQHGCSTGGPRQRRRRQHVVNLEVPVRGERNPRQVRIALDEVRDVFTLSHFLLMIVLPGGKGVCWYCAEKAIGPISRFSSISTWAGSCSGWRSSPYCRV